MKIFAIRDENDAEKKDLAYLLYYEQDRQFFTELPENADPWETPLILSSFVKRNEKSVNSYWSKVWVQQRIVPPDRQNIGQILKDNGLTEYDEYGLLMLAMGRCAQDDYYLVPMEKETLPEKIRGRFQKRIDGVMPMDDYNVLVFFRNGMVKKCSLHDFFQKNKAFGVLLNRKELFDYVRVQTGGHGVAWDINMTISDYALYQMGMEIPLTAADFNKFIVHCVITASEAAEILNCSRQNIEDLTRRGRLHPIKCSGKTTLYLKSELLNRKWK